jgi:hypothetical protein
MVKRPLESDVSSEILRYFEICKKWDNHEYVIPVTGDLEFLNEARRRFHGERFETLYRAWRFGELCDRDLRAEFCQLVNSGRIGLCSSTRFWSIRRVLRSVWVLETVTGA